MSSQNLGSLISTHGTSPRFLQRAAIVALVSFVFFLLMLAAFYARPQIGYFILATAFLLVDLFTLIGIWMQKRRAVRIYEHGLRFQNHAVSWPEIARVQLSSKSGLTIDDREGGSIVIPNSIDGLHEIAARITSGQNFSASESDRGQ